LFIVRYDTIATSFDKMTRESISVNCK
jgi:hypothetical protein